MPLTIAIVGASVSALPIMVPHCLIVRDDILCTFGIDELVVTPASRPLVLLHLPLFQTAQSNVFSHEHVEGGVNVSQRIITDKYDRVEPLQNHANLRCRIPPVVASRGKIRRVESMSTPSAH